MAPIRIENSRKPLDPSTTTTENERPAIFYGHIRVICHTDMITFFHVTNDKIESRSNIKRWRVRGVENPLSFIWMFLSYDKLQRTNNFHEIVFYSIFMNLTTANLNLGKNRE